MTASAATRPPGYISEFDSLRAMAAFGVLIAHFGLFKDIPVVSYVSQHAGLMGVDLFFVLSSYLITGILWRCRSYDQPVIVTLKQFYMRRFLRIFPLYYGVLGLAFIMVPTIRKHAIWFLAYAANFGQALAGTSWRPLQHFWTLAVEEQYYIIWPLVVLLASRRMLLFYCVFGAVVSFGSRCLLTFLGANSKAVTLSTFCCLEPLALGAICAILHSMKNPRRFDRYFKYALVVGAIATVGSHIFGSEAVEQIFSRTAYSFLWAGMLATIAAQSGHPALWLLRQRFPTYLGRISYGLYVLHLPALTVMRQLGMEATSFAGRLVDFIVFSAVTIVLSALSWHLFESPLNDLKRYFPYRQVVAPTPALQPERK